MKYLNFIKKHLPSFIAPVAGIITALIIILIYSKDKSEAAKSFLIDSFTSKYYFGSLLNSMAFLLLAGCGSAISIRSGKMNLGGEGQIYLGGFIGCIILNYLNAPPVLTFIIALFCVIFSGIICGAISAFLYERKGADVLLTSFLLSAAIIPLTDGLITASKQTSSTNILSLPYIKNCYRFKSILPPSSLTFTFFIALICVVLLYIYFNYTASGRRTEIWGKAPQFAIYAGYSSKANSYSSLCISTSLHALTGFFAVCGTYGTCPMGFYSGMGWNALSTSLIASSSPVALIPSSFILSWLYTSTDRITLTQSFNFDMSSLIQGTVLFFIAIESFIKLRRKAK